MKRFMTHLIAAFLLIQIAPARTAEVLIGAGDLIRVAVYGSPDLNTEARVNENGNITFPLLGQVQVGGQTTAVAEQTLAKLLERGGFLKKPQINILITSLISQQISVLGQVNRPGRYPVDGRRKVLDMLAVAGGIATEGGDTVNLVRTRQGKTQRESIDVIEMVRKGEMDKDYEVSAGDVIFVERAPRFYITGEVQRPGAFRVERAMTVEQAVSAGGGLTARGTTRRMSISRLNPDGNSTKIDAKAGDRIQADDVVTVRESWF